ncbi:hypothetical protein CVD25_04540 [Bacillus canaveralius]|uniref:Uncharacterized protein n=1 Tax=Bacillus canaveralius TaxID=1403243 RepID=A0A2N5GRA7_9BACI|nr:MULTISPECIES: SIMPL domain-containing protein [Bacillus]PLR84471.1 hypothetical protein CVD23_11195 [Bacillus sp. V33-4]PLR85986.1 hypothetical protein CU635_02830 [Bacillus canaveralius]PLS00105.1 hypothetical protein CVD25_04540 [Bacillus canaveralius]RSK53391.1 DUF541 domain-containing protein [Bacillus canaveralius]
MEFIQRNSPYRHQARNVLTVNGEGTVSAPPDRAEVVLGAITEGKELLEVQQLNSNIITNVIQALLRLGLPREKIQTFEYSAEPQYDYVDGKQVFRAYRVTYLLKITIDAISQAGKVVDTAFANGANIVRSIEFTISNEGTLYARALAIAVQDSLNKAAVIAQTIGVQLIKTPSLIIENPQTREPIIFHSAVLSSSTEAATPIEQGMLTIKAAVKAEYVYYA